MNRTVLVTGAFGFAGSHLVKVILESTDWNVVALAGLTYVDNPMRLNYLNSSRLKTVWWDLRSPLNGHVDNQIGHIDDVLHLASNSHVDRSIDDPVNFVADNVNITLNLLEWARSRQLGHFIQISTDEVYGPAPLGYDHKEWDPIIPSNPYSASKAAQEAIAISYWRTYGIRVVITNCMNLFGPGQDPEKFVPKVIRCIREDIPVPIHGTTDADGCWVYGSRKWIDVRNHAYALCFLLDKPVSAYGDSGVDRPDRYNISGQVELSNFEIASTIAKEMGEEFSYEQVDFHSSRPGHDLRYSLDSTKLTELGWNPPISFEQGIRDAIEWG